MFQKCTGKDVLFCVDLACKKKERKKNTGYQKKLNRYKKRLNKDEETREQGKNNIRRRENKR